MNQQRHQQPLPYVPFSTFLSVLDKLRGLPLNSEFTREECGRMSDATWGQLHRAFRFFGLLNQRNVPTVSLIHLVEADERKRLLADLLRKNYRELFKLDLKRVSLVRVDETLATYGVTGSTVTRARSFFIAASRHAGIELSPSLLKVARHRVASTQKQRKQSSAQLITIQHDARNSPGTTDKFTASLSVNLADLQKHERQRFYELFDQLVALIRHEPVLTTTKTSNSSSIENDTTIEPGEEHVH
jgi:hypothetical protein